MRNKEGIRVAAAGGSGEKGVVVMMGRGPNQQGLESGGF